MSDTQNSGTTPVRARLFYHWKKPGAKERHGFAMGVFTAADKSPEALVQAIKKTHSKLAEFDIFLDKVEWR